MIIRCEGGILDGHEFTCGPIPEPVIYQSGLTVLRVHQPYPKRKGEKITERLLTYWEEYDLTLTEQGPVYRCRNPFDGVTVGDARVEPSEGGGYDVYADRDGKLHARKIDA